MLSCWCGPCQSQVAASRKRWEEEIEVEKARSENLIERLNDLSDVHQDELITVKQVLYLSTIYCQIHGYCQTNDLETSRNSYQLEKVGANTV